MNRLLQKLNKKDENEQTEDVNDALNDDVALDHYKDELETHWKEFVHRARVHEMLKCLQSEHKKLQILRDNIDFEEIIQNDEGARNSLDRDEGPKSSGRASGEADKTTNVLYARNKPETADSQTEVIPQIKKGSKAAVNAQQSAIDMFKSKNVITDEEFEEILELCDDKVEQQALRDAFEEKKNREKYLHNADERRQMLYDFINSKFFTQFMLVTIIVSIVGIFLLTFETISTRYSFPLMILDSCIIAIFVVEATFKIIIYRGDYFKQVWNLLDMLIIVVHLVELTVDLITKTLALSTDISATVWFKFLKSLRALRLLRIIKFLPNLQVVVTTVFQSMLSMGSIAVLMVLFIFVFAVMGRGLFFEDSPVHFGSIWLAFITLFQLLTLDDWFELLDPVKPKDNEDNVNDKSFQYWLMFGYLFCYIVIEYFVFLNLFVAVLVDNFQLTLADAEVRKKKEQMMFLEGQQKFDDMNNSELDKNDLDEEFLKSNIDLMNPNSLELNVEDYFPVQKGSKDAELIANIFKDLNSLDFERFMWKRRLTLLNMVMDQALTAQRNTWSVQDAESLRNKKVSIAADA